MTQHHHGPDQELLHATFITLEFTTYKNGDRSEVIGLGHNGEPLLYPVRALVARN